jgi:hypothetical protein
MPVSRTERLIDWALEKAEGLPGGVGERVAEYRQERAWSRPGAVAEHGEWMTKVVAESDRLDRLNPDFPDARREAAVAKHVYAQDERLEEFRQENGFRERGAESRSAPSDVYGQEVTDKRTGKEYRIEAADTGNPGFAIQVQDIDTERVLYASRSNHTDPHSALDQGKAWLDKNVIRSRDEPREIVDMKFEGPRTDRGWVAHDLNHAAALRRAGDLTGAKDRVMLVREDRISYQPKEQTVGISR